MAARLTLADGATVAGIAGAGIALLALVASGIAVWYARSQAYSARRSADLAGRSAVAAEQQLAVALRLARASEDQASIAGQALGLEESQVAERRYAGFPRVEVTGGAYGQGGYATVAHISGEGPAIQIALTVVWRGQQWHGHRDSLSPGERADVLLRPVGEFKGKGSFADALSVVKLLPEDRFVGVAWSSTGGGTARHAGVESGPDLPKTVVLDECHPSGNQADLGGRRAADDDRRLSR